MYMMVMAVAMAEGHYGISGDGGHGHSGCSHYVQEFSCIVHVHCTYILSFSWASIWLMLLLGVFLLTTLHMYEYKPS